MLKKVCLHATLGMFVAALMLGCGGGSTESVIQPTSSSPSPKSQGVKPKQQPRDKEAE